MMYPDGYALLGDAVGVTNGLITVFDQGIKPP
jgi:hypothetical protein